MNLPPTCSAALKTGGVPHGKRAYSRNFGIANAIAAQGDPPALAVADGDGRGKNCSYESQ